MDNADFDLKGVWQEIFGFRFFPKSVYPWPILNYYEIRGDIGNFLFIAGVNDTSEYIPPVLFTPVNSLSHKVVDKSN